MKHIKLFEGFLNENSDQNFADKHAKIIVDDEWIDSDDFKPEWTDTDFAEYADNKMNLYNREVLKNNKNFDNSKGDILNSITKYMKTQTPYQKLKFLK